MSYASESFVTPEQLQILNHLPLPIQNKLINKFNQLDALLLRLKRSDVDTQEKYKLLVKAIKQNMLDNVVCYCAKYLHPAGSNKSVMPALAQGVSDMLLRNFCGNDSSLPIACGVLALCSANYFGLSKILFGESEPELGWDVLDGLEDKIKEHIITGDDARAQRLGVKLTLILCSMLLKVEISYINELAANDDFTKNYRIKSTAGHFTFGSISGLCSGFTTVISTLFRAGASLVIEAAMNSLIGVNNDKNLEELNQFYGNKDLRFNEALFTLIQFYARNDLGGDRKDSVYNLPTKTMKKVVEYLDSKKLLKRKSVCPLFSQECVDIERLVEIGIANPSAQVAKPVARPVISPPHLAVVKPLPILTLTRTVTLQPRDEALAKKLEQKRRVTPPDSPKLAERPKILTAEEMILSQAMAPKNELATYKIKLLEQVDIYDSLAGLSAGWQCWVETKKMILHLCYQLLESAEQGLALSKTKLAEISKQFQFILVCTNLNQNLLKDWFLLDEQREMLNQVIKQHFALQLTMVRYFEKQGWKDAAHWLSGFYPYLPEMNAERLMLYQLAVHLAGYGIELREVGTSVFMPGLAEDIDIIIWSASKTYIEIVTIFDSAIKAIQPGWACDFDKPGEGCHLLAYKKAGATTIDVTIYQNMSEQLLPENLRARWVNIAAAAVNVIFSSLRLRSEDALTIHERTVECRTWVDSKTCSALLVKTLWKVKQTPGYKLGRNFSAYEQSLKHIRQLTTTFHFIELINWTKSRDRVSGLWDMFLDIYKNNNLTQCIPTIYADQSAVALNKLQKILFNDRNTVRGWLLLALYTFGTNKRFFEQEKLGLKPEQAKVLMDSHLLITRLQAGQDCTTESKRSSRLYAELAYWINEYWKPEAWKPEPVPLEVTTRWRAHLQGASSPEPH
jgi:hypothetical protein